jgi:hypothetical protein
VKAPPTSTKESLEYRLRRHARQRWPELADLQVRFRANFAYLDAVLPDGTALKLCRLRYGGSASIWGFAIYRASHDDYEDSFLPSGVMGGSPEEALDCAGDLYLSDLGIWLRDTPTN